MANVAGTTLADRNNNPVNLIDTNIPWQGAVGSNAGFETFSNPELGVRAAAKNLYTSQETHGNSTLAEIITRHAPPEDYNDTLAYIDKVSADTGIGANDTLPNLKTHPHITKAIITSMAHQEGATVGPDGKYTDAIIEQGVKGANGGEMVHATQAKDFDAAGFTTAKDSGGQETNRERGIRTDAKAKRIQTGKVTNLVAPNWLSTVDSPTYRWTLYIVDNDIWNDPIILGDDDAALKTQKAFIIAQQGTTTEFSLDNFAAMSVVTPGQRHGNTTPGVIQFDLFENLGFTFLDKALRAAQIIKKPANLHSQNYILKLEFLGRDPVTSASTTFNGIFFYPVKLNQIRSTTGPEGTRYNIIAWSMIKHAQTESVTDCDITIKNIRTVKDLTDGLVKQFNKGQKEAMNKEDFKAGRQPPKQIAIVFDGSSKVVSMPGTKTADIEENFTLETRIYSNITDSADSGGQNVSPDDPDTCDVTIERETSIPMKLGDLIQKNCKEWIDWQLELEKQGLKAAIVVDPTYEYSKKDQKEYAGKMLYASVEPILVTFTIKIYINKTSPDLSLTEHAKKLKDPIFQKQKINNTKIEKAYTFMYSGTNTEVLNYQIDVQNLYVVVDHPQGGQYGHGRGSDGEPQFAPTAIPTSPYLEDIPYTAESVFNDLVHGGATKADSAEDAQLNATGIDSRSALAHKISQMAKREYDAWKFDLEIKGDPYWMGNMQAIIKGKLETPDYSKRDALISFVQWNPNADNLIGDVDGILEGQTKGPIDVVSSGVYKLTSIESRFQGGKFTQTLSGYKDVTTNTSLVLGRLIELSGDM